MIHTVKIPNFKLREMFFRLQNNFAGINTSDKACTINKNLISLNSIVVSIS